MNEEERGGVGGRSLHTKKRFTGMYTFCLIRQTPLGVDDLPRERRKDGRELDRGSDRHGLGT